MSFEQPQNDERDFNALLGERQSEGQRGQGSMFVIDDDMINAVRSKAPEPESAGDEKVQDPSTAGRKQSTVFTKVGRWFKQKIASSPKNENT